MNTMELTCAECEYESEQEVYEEVSRATDEVTWWARWTCPNCNYDNEQEDWYNLSTIGK